LRGDDQFDGRRGHAHSGSIGGWSTGVDTIDTALGCFVVMHVGACCDYCFCAAWNIDIYQNVNRFGLLFWTRTHTYSMLIDLSITTTTTVRIVPLQVAQGALPILMDMSGSHDPKIRQNSVAALCELTSCLEVKGQMVEQGAVKSLVLTGLIRASEDDPATCNSCCKALYNLLSTEGKFEQIIQDGVVWALTTMLGLTKEMRSLGMIGLCNIAR